MATLFPGALDQLVNPTANDKTNVVSHAAQHANANDAIEALEAKVGVDGSAVTSTHDYKLSSVTGPQKAVSDSDVRLTDERTPLEHIHPITDITDLSDTLSAKAPLNSPVFTGTPTGITKSHVGLGNVDDTADSAKPVSTAQQNALNLKANLASPTFTGTVTVPDASFGLSKLANMATASLYYRRTAGSGAPEVNTLAQLKTDLALVKGDVGLGSVDNTSDTGKPVSTAQQTALDLKANVASPTFTGTVTVPDASFSLAKLANMATASLYYRRTAGSGAPEVNTLPQLKTDLALAKADVGLGSVDNTSDTGKPISTAQQTALAAILSGYRTLLDVSGSHTAAKVAGTYAFGHGDVLAVTGTGTLYPLATIYIAAADYPTAAGLAAKLRIRAQLYTNDVAPFTGTFVISLHPITRPATSGGTGLCIYTVGAAVAGSGLTFTNPAADSLLNGVGSDFALPSDGHYAIAAVTNQTMAASSHVHLSASLQQHNA